MAHNPDPRGYCLSSQGTPRPVRTERLDDIRILVDPGCSGATSGRAAITACRELLEHVDALQGELDRVERGIIEALADDD